MVGVGGCDHTYTYITIARRPWRYVIMKYWVHVNWYVLIDYQLRSGYTGKNTCQWPDVPAVISFDWFSKNHTHTHTKPKKTTPHNKQRSTDSNGVGVCVGVCMHMHVCVCACVHVCVCARACVCACVRMSACVSAHVFRWGRE